jgi:phage baseplate assembly protein W
MANIYKKLIGKGPLFPIQLITNEQGKVGWYPVDGDPELIKENITALLYYMIGQRIRQETFGTRLWECIEEPNVQALSFLIKDFLTTALTTWEGRIILQDIQTARAGSKLNILVTYAINGTNSSQFINIEYDLTNT